MDFSTDRHIGDILKERNILLKGADAAGDERAGSTRDLSGIIKWSAREDWRAWRQRIPHVAVFAQLRSVARSGGNRGGKPPSMPLTAVPVASASPRPTTARGEHRRRRLGTGRRWCFPVGAPNQLIVQNGTNALWESRRVAMRLGHETTSRARAVSRRVGSNGCGFSPCSATSRVSPSALVTWRLEVSRTAGFVSSVGSRL